MRPREGFQRKATGICPTEQDLKDGTIKQTEEEGTDVWDHKVLEVKAGFSLPDAGDLLEEVLFTEPRREAADRLARPPSEEGHGAGPPPREALTTGAGWLLAAVVVAVPSSVATEVPGQGRGPPRRLPELRRRQRCRRQLPRKFQL